MKIALVYDRVNKFGGAERFLKTIISIFPNSPIYTLVSDTEKSGWVGKQQVIASFLNKIKYLRTRHEFLAPIAPMAFESHNFKDFDLVISVTSSDAKSIITHPHQTHICICLTPTRYLWSGRKNYKKDLKIKLLPKFIFRYFRFVDKLLSSRPDHFVAISKEVQRRIAKYYHRDSKIIYPPVEKYFFVKSPQLKAKRKYFLVVSRLVPYKKIDLVVKVFNKLNKKLIIVGEGSEQKKLQKLANKNIVFTGKVSDIQLKKYYQSAKAVIFPQREDFGLVPLESQAAGTPVIAYGRGGARETIINNKTGLFFHKQSPTSLLKAIKEFDTNKISYLDCLENAKKFSQTNFKKELIDFINISLESNIYH